MIASPHGTQLSDGTSGDQTPAMRAGVCHDRHKVLPLCVAASTLQPPQPDGRFTAFSSMISASVICTYRNRLLVDRFLRSGEIRPSRHFMSTHIQCRERAVRRCVFTSPAARYLIQQVKPVQFPAESRRTGIRSLSASSRRPQRQKIRLFTVGNTVPYCAAPSPYNSRPGRPVIRSRSQECVDIHQTRYPRVNAPYPPSVRLMRFPRRWASAIMPVIPPASSYYFLKLISA